MKINEIERLPSYALDPNRVNYHLKGAQKDVANKKGTENTIQKFGKYKFVPVTTLPAGFYLAYKNSPDEFSTTSRDKFMVVLIDTREDINKPKVVTYIWFNPQNVYFGEPNYSSISGMKVASVGTASEYKGKGYALQVYKMLVEHGQIIFSDTSQTPDGTKLWMKLIESGQFSAWGLVINKSSTLELVNALGPIDSSNLQSIMGEMFSRYSNQFVLVPKNDIQTIELLKTKRSNETV